MILSEIIVAGNGILMLSKAGFAYGRSGQRCYYRGKAAAQVAMGSPLILLGGHVLCTAYKVKKTSTALKIATKLSHRFGSDQIMSMNM